jgi:arylsulfatase A-like enzyme
MHIEATDRSIGRLLESLPGDTRVVVTSVHGDMHGSHGLFRKGWPHEESVRVPLLIRGGQGALRDDSPYSLTDLPRITIGWARGSADLPPAGAAAQISMPSVVRLPDQCDRIWRCVRTPARKLVLNGDGSPWLFFDLEQDPLEMNNLALEPSRSLEIAALKVSVTP